METLREAKDHLRKNWEKGTTCPCCGQFVKRYRIKLNSFMSRFLISLYQETEKGMEWVHLNDIVKGKKSSGLYGYLPMWGLAVKAKNDDPSKKFNGYWRITEKGRLFVEGLSMERAYVFTYDNKFLGFDGDLIHITDSLGVKFDYEELMRG